MPSLLGRKRHQMPRVCRGGMFKLRFDWYISSIIFPYQIWARSSEIYPGFQRKFFLIDISRQSCVKEAQSAEPRKKKLPLVTGAHNVIFMREISSEIELGHRLDTPMSTGNYQYNNGPDWLHQTTSLRGIEKPVFTKADHYVPRQHVNKGRR